MRKLDEQEKKIVRELIRNPRISDNQIGKNTGVPVKTVNRKRKHLEDERILYYFTFLNKGEAGLGMYEAQSMYVVKLKYGITTLSVKNQFADILNNKSLLKHTLFSSIGEHDGNIALVFILESAKREDLVEIFNAEIVPMLIQRFGHNAIIDVQTIPLTREIKMMHNYMPNYNMNKGIIRKDWPNDKMFIS